MTSKSVGSTFRRWYPIPVAAVLFGSFATATNGAPSEATKERCARYAQRAVQQYQLMISHPQCQANTDPLNWQDNYDNHYNGCLIFPESMIRFADAARDNHLHACGALMDSATSGVQASGDPAPTPGTVPAAATAPPAGTQPTAGVTSATGMTNAANPSPAGAPPQVAATANSAATPNSAAPKTGCQLVRPRALPAHATQIGLGATVRGTALSFEDWQHNGQRVTYQVVRPAYIVKQMPCTGRIESLFGPWISMAGPKMFYVNLDGSVSEGTPFSAASAAELLAQ